MFRNLLTGLFLLAICSLCTAQETATVPPAQDDSTFAVANGTLKFIAPAGWEKIKPKSSMLEAEFSIPKIGDDPTNGRITFMAAGGSIQANIDRWIGQFKNADGSAISGITPTVSDVDGKKVHVLDVSGTFADSMRGPMGPKTDRENYRMLGSIVESDSGKYFIKFYGPKPTVDANAALFKTMLMGMNGAKEESKSNEPIVFEVADGGLQFTATGAWKKVKPRSNMLEAEFQIPNAKEGENNGRLTIMGAGGSVQANMNRWIGQFTTPDGDPISGVEPSSAEFDGYSLHRIDISGTFAEGMGGPMGPKTERDDYRMLGSIIETEDFGKYFVKFYGPKSVVDANEKAYAELITSMKLLE